jgi:hypothetical protein
MKRNLFASGLLAVLTGLASAHASLAQNRPPSYSVNPVSPFDVSSVAAAIKSRIEAWGYGTVENLARDRSGVWHAQVMRNKVEIAVSVDKGGRITVQPGYGQLAARCSQLFGIASRYVSGHGGEGSPGPNMGVIGAGLDCQKGRYDDGIKALEKILSRQRISYPPS